MAQSAIAAMLTAKPERVSTSPAGQAMVSMSRHPAQTALAQQQCRDRRAKDQRQIDELAPAQPDQRIGHHLTLKVSFPATRCVSVDTTCQSAS
jgi:hypothetical protein